MKNIDVWGVFSLLDQKTPAHCSSEFVLGFLKVITTVISCIYILSMGVKPTHKAVYDATLAKH
jgi:hypothetical protein